MGQPLFSFGIIADCQYADIPNALDGKGVERCFRDSPRKLKEAIDFFNTKDLKFVVHLGDLIDQDLASFDTVLPICAQSKAPLLQLAGNHDFCGKDYVYGEDRDAVLQKLGLEKAYYSHQVEDWRFIALDGNEVGTIEWPQGSEQWSQGKVFIQSLEQSGRVNAKPWNGGVGAEQQAWLLDELQAAETEGQQVIIFCHESIFPDHQENLLNDKELLPHLAAFKGLRAFINGHNHAGNYGQYQHLHCLTVHGMVDTDQNSYALAHVYSDRIEIEGYGREPSRTLVF